MSFQINFRKKKIITIVFILIFVLLLIFLISYYMIFNQKSEEFNVKNILLRDFEIVQKNTKIKDDDLISVSNGNITVDKKKVYKNDKIKSKGQFIYVDKQLYGFLEFNGYCLQKKYNISTPILTKGECNINLNIREVNNLVKEKQTETKKVNDSEKEINKNYPYSIEYYFYGSNPNNYLVFSNNCWRIIGFSVNNLLKIVYDGPVSKYGSCEYDSDSEGSVALTTWDRRRYEIGDWETRSSLAKYMLSWEENSRIQIGKTDMTLDSEKMESVEWYIGTVEAVNSPIEDILYQETIKKTSEKRKIGLMNVSDYLRLEKDKTNYLRKRNYQWWLINLSSLEEKKVWIVTKEGNLESKKVVFSNEFYFSGVRPVIYLKENTKLIGNGTQYNPYQVVN